MIDVEKISPEVAADLCRRITADLPEYFGLPECNEHYAIGVRSRVNLAAKVNNQYIGLLSLDFPYPNNSNIYWMAVFRDHQQLGMGHALVEAACRLANDQDIHTMTVETLSPSESDENYRRTYQFYISCGFEPLFNLKPQGYEWNMVYLSRNLEKFLCLTNTPGLVIRTFTESDIPIIVSSFAAHQWTKPRATFEEYLREQQKGERLIWVALVDHALAGYITLRWESRYPPFLSRKIPEIMDLNVLPPFRKSGVGSKLLETAESAAKTKSKTIGIGVGLYAGDDGGYGPAQRLYVNSGYVPDGMGVTYDYQPVAPGTSIALDDDLVLWFTKTLAITNF